MFGMMHSFTVMPLSHILFNVLKRHSFPAPCNWSSGIDWATGYLSISYIPGLILRNT